MTGETESVEERDLTAPDEDAPGASAQAVFHQQWQIYRTMVDHNYLYHREV